MVIEMRSKWIMVLFFILIFFSLTSSVEAADDWWNITWGYRVKVEINPLMIIIIIATSFLFSGIGMIIGRFVKEEETADVAGGAITFPMMFLAGTFFSLDMMPEFLQTFAKILPLYYVNEGLRNAMIYLNQSEAIINTIYVLIFAIVFFVTGLFLTKWKED